MINRCPTCGAVQPTIWCGVRFPPLKERIFQAIKRAGSDGIMWDDLYDLIYGDWRPGARERLKSHTAQINDMIEDTGWRIDGRGGAYALRQIGKQRTEKENGNGKRNRETGTELL